MSLQRCNRNRCQNEADCHPHCKECNIKDYLQGIVAKAILDKTWHRLSQIDTLPNEVGDENDLPLAQDFGILSEIRTVLNATGKRGLEADFGACLNEEPDQKRH